MTCRLSQSDHFRSIVKPPDPVQPRHIDQAFAFIGNVFGLKAHGKGSYAETQRRTNALIFYCVNRTGGVQDGPKGDNIVGLTPLNHAFKRLIKRDYTAFGISCLNSDPRRNHPAIHRSPTGKNPLFKAVWIVERADGEIGPVGTGCAASIAKKLGMRLMDFPDLTKRDDPMTDGDDQHETEETPNTPKKLKTRCSGDFDEKAESRPSVARSYATDYAALMEEFRALRLTQIPQYRPRSIGIALSNWQKNKTEENAVALCQAADAENLYNLDSLQRLHKLFKLIGIMGNYCADHLEVCQPTDAEVASIEQKSYRERSSHDWIVLGSRRLPQWMTQLQNREEPYHMQLSERQMTFCTLLADDLGHPGEFNAQEFVQFIKPDFQSRQTRLVFG